VIEWIPVPSPEVEIKEGDRLVVYGPLDVLEESFSTTPVMREHIMRCKDRGRWPVPNSYTRRVPRHGIQGSFWEDRLDRRHCGVDIYAPAGSSVLAFERGEIVATGIATSPAQRHYWNVTHHATVLHDSGFVVRYAELDDVMVSENARVAAGEVLGHVGRVIDPLRVTRDDPPYVQRLSVSAPSMLHVEVHDRCVDLEKERRYSGGNWFSNERPSWLVNPTSLLMRLVPGADTTW